MTALLQEVVYPTKTSPAMSTISIVVVEDEPDFREWILEELEEDTDIQCLKTFDTGEEALVEIPKLRPDVVVMDLNLGKDRMNGTECIFKLRLEAPGLKFLVLSSHVDETHVFEALKVGARAYLQKGDIPGKLADLIRRFQDGYPSMSPAIAQLVMNHFNRSEQDLRLIERLTKRELEVLHELSEGLSYKMIAGKLYISDGTVKQHATRIYDKLEVNSKAEAIRLYLG
ncbi:MAG: response regulator transcription factor [Bacteroidota bacterium]